MDLALSLALAAFAMFFASLPPSLSSMGTSVYCFLLAWMTQVHRPCERRGTAWDMLLGVLAAFLPLAVFGPLPMASMSGAMQEIGMLVQLFALMGMIWCVFTLSASFGIEPADRGLVMSGPYLHVRHPQYVFGMLFGLGYVLIEPGWVSVPSWLLLSAAQIVLALREERIIVGYDEYAALVCWRFIPRVV